MTDITMARVTVCWPWREHGSLPNTAACQRLKLLAGRHQVVVLALPDAEFADDLRSFLEIHTSPDFRSRYINLVVFYLWITVLCVRRGIARSHDLVYTFYELSCLAGLVSKLLGTPWVADILDDPALELENERRRTHKRMAILAVAASQILVAMVGLRHADRVITVGLTADEGLPEVLTRRYRVRYHRLVVVPNGVDLDLVKPSSETAIETPPDSTRLDVLYVGYVSELRGVGTILEAVHLARKELGQVTLTLVGPTKPDDTSWLEDQLNILDLRGTVSYPGRQPYPAVIEAIAGADVCVCLFPRRQEEDVTFPIKVFEYLAMGKCVLASRLTAMSRIVRHEENGLLVEPGDSRGAAAQLIRIAKDPVLRRRLELNARPSVSRFSWQEIGEKIQAAIAEVVTTKP